MRYDVAIVGGGPAGLAVAIEARLRGLSVVVLERQVFPVDKACGEGLLPAGVVALQRLGVWPHLERAECAGFDVIRYVQEDGRFADGALPAPGGVGIRRLALSRAMVAAAHRVGAELREGAGVRAHAVSGDGVSLTTDAGAVEAKLLVAADGLNSALRRAEGLALASFGPRRFGLRRHFSLAPWASRVEVHFSAGAEAYVTPAGARRVGVAFLWDADSLPEPGSFDGLLSRFPALVERLRDAVPDSESRGAGPLNQSVARRTKARFALIGDAGGSVDAISGEGLSLAFEQARALGDVLPAAVSSGTVEALAPYERAAARAFASYARVAGGLAWLAARPRLRRIAVDGLSAAPGAFSWALRFLVAPVDPPPSAVAAE